MIDFGKCLKKGEIVVGFHLNCDYTDDEFMHNLVMGEKLPNKEGDNWEFDFSGFDNETDEIGDEVRFARVSKIDAKNVTVNRDGTHSLILCLAVWENKRLFKARKTENAILVPLEIRYIPGKMDSVDFTRDLLCALICAEKIRAKRKKELAFEPLANGITRVTAPDNSTTEVNSLVMEKAQALIEEFGIVVVSLDVDNVKCGMGEIHYLNLHIDNPEVLANESFEAKRHQLTTFADKYDWDVWFVAPGHSRNAFIESLTAL